MLLWFQVNAEKMQNVHQKLQAFLAQEKEQKERAQRCFVSYIRSVYLMKNKEVFDVFKLQVQEYALSLGLAVAPRVRFLSKALAEKAEKESQRVEEQSEEEELKSFKAQLIGTNFDQESQSFESEGTGDTEESGNEKQVYQSKRLLQYADDEDESENNLKELDLLTVKRKDVFCLMGNRQSLEEPAKSSKTKTGTKTKFEEAKKVLKRKFQVNRKVVFNQEGKAVQVWPPVQRAVIEENKEEDEVSGINVEKARERLKREDLEFDKWEYSRKVKAKHREERMKAKVARKEASKKNRQKSEEEEEDEVVAYLANNSEDDFDPSTLPDPDKLHLEKEEEEEERLAKRQHSDNSDEEEQELTSGKRKKVRQQEGEEHTPLDTSLSLAEDEELVLHLLRGLQ